MTCQGPIAFQWHNDAWNQVLILYYVHNKFILSRIKGCLTVCLGFLVHCVKLAFYSDVFTSEDILTLSKLCFSEMANSYSKQLTNDVAYYMKLTNPNPITHHSLPTPIILWHSPSKPKFSTLIAPCAGTRQLRAAPIPQSLLKLFSLTNPEPAYPASPVLFPWKPQSRLAHVFLPLLLLPDQLWCLLVWPGIVWHGLSSWEMWGTNYLFIGSYFMSCWFHKNWIIIKPTLKISMPPPLLFFDLSFSPTAGWAPRKMESLLFYYVASMFLA